MSANRIDALTGLPCSKGKDSMTKWRWQHIKHLPTDPARTILAGGGGRVRVPRRKVFFGPRVPAPWLANIAGTRFEKGRRIARGEKA